MPTLSTSEDRINRLQAKLQGRNSRTASGQPEEVSIFTSIALHALGRQRRGKTPLSKLEALTVGLLNVIADSDQELNAYVDAVSSTRRSGIQGGWLTPATLSLGEDEPYTKEHFQKDISSMGTRMGINGESPQFPAYCRMIDPVTDEYIGHVNASFDAAVQETGRSVTVFWSDPKVSENGKNALNASSTRIKLQPLRFKCHKESGELGKDEIYWSLASGADTGDQLGEKQVTTETGSVQTGKLYHFPSGYILFDGQIMQALSAHIVCWEADHSNSAWYDKLIRVSREISSLASEMSVITGDQGWDELIGLIPGYDMRQEILFWIENIASFIANMLDIFRNHDDKVAEAHLVWNRKALECMFPLDMSSTGGGMFPPSLGPILQAMFGEGLHVPFNGGGGGNHTLVIGRVKTE
jgi:hypothetical protein